MRKITDPRNLPYLGATVQAVLFAIAGELALPLFGWLVGLGAGAVVNYSIALASSRIDGIAQKRQPLARLALLGMWLISPAVIVLSLFMPASVWTAIAWAVCVDTAIILAGAIAGKSLIPQEQPKGTSKAAKPVSKAGKVARKPVKDNDLLAYFQGKPGASDTQAAEYFGISRQAVGQRRKKLYKVPDLSH